MRAHAYSLQSTDGDDLDWHLRLQLPRVEGQLLSRRSAAAKMLPYYAARFPTVEINYTFYRMPNEKLVGGLGGADAVAVQADAEGAAPDHARQPAEELRRARRAASARSPATLGDKLGALLFQLPPNLKKDLALFDAFLDELPPKVVRRVRVPPSVVARRRGLRAAARRATSRCASPTARSCRRRCGSPPTTRTSGCATKATRRTTSRAGPTRSRARPAACRDVFVYFKHEEEGKGPEFAQLLMTLEPRGSRHSTSS